LVCHPDTPCATVLELTADVARNEYEQLIIRFVARGKVGDILIPPPARYVARADNLWQTTCFEAFVHATKGNGYFEFNFSPSTAWAAYRFSAYRTNMESIALDPPHFDVEIPAGALELTVVVDLSCVAHLAPDQIWSLALSAVIEDRTGAKSYWALAHPPGKPDFHHKDCFALTLPAPEAP
jgi:hypothetical protein